MLLKYKILLSFFMIFVLIGSSYCVGVLNDTNNTYNDTDSNKTNNKTFNLSFDDEFLDDFKNSNFFSAARSPGSPIYVDPNGNDSNDGSLGNPFKTIGKAVNNSSAGDTIILNDGIYNDSNDKNIQINHSLTMAGKSYSGSSQDFTTSAILDAGNNGQFLETKSGAILKIYNITFQNANASSDKLGGAISTSNGIECHNCVFKNNRARLSVTETGGGAMHVNGTGNSQLIIDNCIFDGNEGPLGGSIYIDYISSTNIQNSLFKNNIATDHGGAIDNVYGNETLIESCNFINNAEKANNTAKEMGGGAINCHEFNDGIGDNRGNIVTIKKCNFNGNSANKNGGAICALSTLNIEECDFSNNIAGKDGAAIYIAYPTLSGIFPATQSNITNCNFTDNKDSGGTVYTNFNSNRNLHLAYSTFTDNNASAVNINGNNSKIEYSTLSNNLNGVKVNGNNNKLSYLNILNNKNDGVSFSGNDSSVSSSQILENKHNGFIINSGVGNMINYNRIYKNGLGGNITSPTSNTNATHNWWGFNNIANQYNNQSPVDISDWYVIELSAPEISTTVNASKTYDDLIDNPFLRYHFKLNNNTIYDIPSLLPYFEVKVVFKNETDNEILKNVPNTDIRDPLTYEVPISFFGYNSYNNQNSFGNNIFGYLLNNIINNRKVYSVEAFSDGEDVKLSITEPEHSLIYVEKLGTNSTGQTGHTINDQFNNHVNFTLKATNNGSIYAKNVVVTDKIPSGFKFISSNDTKYNPINGQWNIGDLSPGESVFLSIEVQIVGTGNLVNVGNIKSDNSPPSPGDSVTVHVPGIPLKNTAMPFILLMLILIISFVAYRRKN